MFFQKMNAYPTNNTRIESNVSSKKTDLTNLIKSESLKTYDESAGEFDYALEFINYSI